jgi:hypothetical protein
MTLHVPRLPFAFDPLIGEAKRRMRQRRLLLAALALALAAGSAGATLALRGPAGPSNPLPTAGHGWAEANLLPQRVSLLYPFAWKRVNWSCWDGPTSPFLLLTTVRPTPTCDSGSFPPQERLGRDGVAVWFEYPAPPLNVMTVSNPNARIGGQPARITDPPLHGLGGSQWVTCNRGAAPARPLGARIQYPGFSGDGILLPRGVLFVGAVVCGPDYAKGDAAVRRMLGTIRFRK